MVIYSARFPKSFPIAAKNKIVLEIILNKCSIGLQGFTLGFFCQVSFGEAVEMFYLHSSQTYLL